LALCGDVPGVSCRYGANSQFVRDAQRRVRVARERLAQRARAEALVGGFAEQVEMADP